MKFTNILLSVAAVALLLCAAKLNSSIGSSLKQRVAVAQESLDEAKNLLAEDSLIPNGFEKNLLLTDDESDEQVPAVDPGLFVVQAELVNKLAGQSKEAKSKHNALQLESLPLYGQKKLLETGLSQLEKQLSNIEQRKVRVGFFLNAGLELMRTHNELHQDAKVSDWKELPGEINEKLVNLHDVPGLPDDIDIVYSDVEFRAALQSTTPEGLKKALDLADQSTISLRGYIQMLKFELNRVEFEIELLKQRLALSSQEEALIERSLSDITKVKNEFASQLPQYDQIVGNSTVQFLSTVKKELAGKLEKLRNDSEFYASEEVGPKQAKDDSVALN